MVPLRLAIFVSGRGSNMKAILEAIEQKTLLAEVKTVVSNRGDAPALTIAHEYGIEPIVVPHLGLKREEHEAIICKKLKPLSIDYIVLAGYMRLLSPYILDQFRNPNGFTRITNIHPSLLPAFPGMSAYEDAFNYGVKISGVTVFLVDEKVDHGPILAQESFPRLAADSLEDFKQRGLSVEHKLYPKVLQEIAESEQVIHHVR